MLVNMVQVYPWPTCNVVERDKDKEISEISSLNLHPVSKCNLKPRSFLASRALSVPFYASFEVAFIYPCVLSNAVQLDDVSKLEQLIQLPSKHFLSCKENPKRCRRFQSVISYSC